ncbi:MAG TPA: indole-3-glycerol phosphate synthase TrpC [Thermoanaerobaculia bacterium]|jgi:indole-3-glycerol phosphate synthase|nr:indole-3-glycerol phosphate synthase TrpC [Thermoanaerobaculia bacterium]
MTILDDIVASTRARLGTEPPPDRAVAEIAARNRPPFALTAALRSDRINVIAEIKSASPSAGTIVETPDVEAIATSYKQGGAAAISIVTEPEFFRGSREWIGRAAGQLPVLMKDFVVDESQLIRGIAAGASAILLLASLLDANHIRDFIRCLDAYSCDALVEVHDEAELDRAMTGGARIIGVNNRNLRDFSVDLAASERLVRQIPAGILRVAESGIKTRADIDRLRAAGFDGFLVGESLLRQNDRAAAVRQLVFGS